MAMFTIRAARDADRNFILASWLHHYKNSSPFAKPILHSVYYKYHHVIVERITTRPTTRIRIACLPDDDSVILGYIVIEQMPDKPCIHFAYVKPAFRGNGILTAFLSDLNINPNECCYTHRTESCTWLVGQGRWNPDKGQIDYREGKWPDATYIPYLV